MLVQVPDGKAAIEKARRYLIDVLKFHEDAVRVHTADEPDANLLALVHDPAVEVLLFKMAVALGFDAPRAFTLAALRGADATGRAHGRPLRHHRAGIYEHLGAHVGRSHCSVYGRVFMVGKRKGSEGFRFWRLTEQDELVDDGPFEAARLRYS